MREKDIKELRAISSPLMFEREVLIKPTKRFINLLTSALDEVESNAKSENESEEKSMLHNVTVKHEENKVLEEYWLMRAVNDIEIVPGGKRGQVMARNNQKHMVRKILKNNKRNNLVKYKESKIGLELNLMDKNGNRLSVGDDIRYGEYIGVLLYDSYCRKYGIHISNSLCCFGDKYDEDSYGKFIEIPMGNGARMEIEKLNGEIYRRYSKDTYG